MKNFVMDEATASRLYPSATGEFKELLEKNFSKDALTNPQNPYKDVCDKLGVSDDPATIKLEIPGFDEGQLKVVRAVIKKMRVCEAYNGRKKLLITDKRFYNWYVRSSAGAGLVFYDSYCNDGNAHLYSAARLSFGTQAHLDDARKKFPDLDLDIIDLK